MAFIISICLLFCVLAGISTYSLTSAAENNEQLVDFVVEVEEGRDIRVLQLTDPQIIGTSPRYAEKSGSYTIPYNPYYEYDKSERYIEQVVREYNPDLIIITGDLVYGEYDDSGRSFLNLIAFMEKLQIPWAPVFGNHDNESFMGADWQSQQLESAEYCLFKQRTLTGNGNYTVGIEQGGVLKRVFFMLDSNGCGDASEISLANGHTKTTAGFGQDQVDWYKSTANKIKQQSPSIKLSFAFHIQIQAFADAYAKYGFDNVNTKNNTINIDTVIDKADGDFGYLGANLKGAWDKDYTIYNGLKALGVDSIFVGHEHLNSASVVYDGIRFQYGQKSSVYDRANYLREDGIIVGSYTEVGEAIIGGTAIPISETDGMIKNPHIIYYDGEKDTSPTINENGEMYFDFNDKDFNTSVTTDEISTYSTSLEKDTEKIPTGYRGSVHSAVSLKTNDMATVGIKFPYTVNIRLLDAFYIRMYVENGASTQGALLRFYDAKNKNMLAGVRFSDYGGEYREWVEVDILPVLKNISSLSKDNRLQPFTLGYVSNSEQSTVYFDEIILVCKGDIYTFSDLDNPTSCQEPCEPTYEEENWGEYNGYTYSRYTLSDFGLEEVLVKAGEKKTVTVLDDSFSFAFNYSPTTGATTKVSLFADSNDGSGLQVLFTDTKFQIIDSNVSYYYNFANAGTTNVEIGFVRFLENDSGLYNGNSGYLFVKINGKDYSVGQYAVFWRIVELWQNRNNKNVTISVEKADASFSSNTTVEYVIDGEVLAKELSANTISVTKEKILYYANNKNFSQVLVNGVILLDDEIVLGIGTHTVILQTPVNVENLDVSILDVTYNGQSHTFTPIVKDGELILTQGIDYNVSYLREGETTLDFINAGSIEVLIEGVGLKYVGVQRKVVVIYPARLVLTTMNQTLDKSETLKQNAGLLSVTGLMKGDMIDAFSLARIDCKVVVDVLTIKNLKGLDVTKNYTIERIEGECHLFGDWIVTREPTTTQNGVKEKRCECGHGILEEIPKSIGDLEEAKGCSSTVSVGTLIALLWIVGSLGIVLIRNKIKR